MADQDARRPRAAGWKKDPSGRHFGRYWDGEAWTQYVISSEHVQGIDPLPPHREPSILRDGSRPPKPATSINRPADRAARSTGASVGLAARSSEVDSGHTRAWLGRRSRPQRGALVALVAVALLALIGALADTDTPTTIDSAGGSASQTTVAETTATTAPTAPSTLAAARIAEGIPAGGDDTTVERIIDGDTLVVAGGTRIRLIGIDAPETVEPGTPVQCFGSEAARYANELMPAGTRIRLIYDLQRLDPYGRTLAYVYKLDDGLFVNRAVARNGFAQQLTVPPNLAHAEVFRVAVSDARAATLGLWGGCQTTTLPVATAAPSTRATSPPVATAAPTTRTTAAPPVQASGCHPSYEGACVPTGFSDVDCAGGNGNGPGYVSGKNFRVVGPDVYDLDGNDNDGIACES